MRLRGGAFVHRLAGCMQVADPENLQIIIGAFPDIMGRYDAFASQAAKQQAKMAERKSLDERVCKDG